jgi:hypothetical protein
MMEIVAGVLIGFGIGLIVSMAIFLEINRQVDKK